MNDMNPMDEDPEKVTDMREKIMHGEYRVEPTAVADAILRRLHELAAARDEHVAPDERARARRYEAQTECSYPESGELAPWNTTPGGPSTTLPTTVKPTVIERLANAVSTSFTPDRGTQAQSS
jgi:Anti-sigma-28 factor, FlgM